MAQTQSNFWSKRKAAVAAEAAQEVEALRLAAIARENAELAERQAEKTDAEILADLGLQDPDQMGLGDDFSAFMQKTVPQHLRQRALRQLWRSNPVLANLDGLIDYGDDYTDAATVKPGMTSDYQVGRGMLRHVVALAEQAEAELAEPELAAAKASGPAIESENCDAPDDMIVEAPPPQAAPAPASLRFEHDQPAPHSRRHMRFAYKTEDHA